MMFFEKNVLRNRKRRRPQRKETVVFNPEESLSRRRSRSGLVIVSAWTLLSWGCQLWPSMQTL